MDIFNIILFLIYLFGFGYTATRTVKSEGMETFVMRLGIGLAIFPVVGVLLNILHIPLDWKVFLVLALAVPLYDLRPALENWRAGKCGNFSISRAEVALAWIFLISFIIYTKGPFAYPWLEDDDPWNHAASAKFIALEKHLNPEQGAFQYLNPYPPGYDMIMGVMHQTHPSLYWTLKFFNGFIISLGILFFYYFIKRFARDKARALAATFFLANIPAYLSHFIWSHSLVVSLLFPVFYAMLRAREDNKFLPAATLATAGLLLIQPTKIIKITIFVVLLWAAHVIIQRKIEQRLIGIYGSACLIAAVWWGPVALNYAQGNLRIPVSIETSSQTAPELAKPRDFIKRMFDPGGGSATRAYTWKDYYFGQESNMINNPVGIGPVICILAGGGLIITLYRITRRRDPALRSPPKVFFLTMIFWLIFTFLGMNSETFRLPVGLFAFRFWMLFAIPVAVLAAEAVMTMASLMPTRLLKYLALGLLLLTTAATSGYEKLRINTVVWPAGLDFSGPKEARLYAWLRKHIPPDTRVFTFSRNIRVIGMDMRADYWTPEYKTAFSDPIHMGVNELYSALRKLGFEYVVIGQKEVRLFGLEKTNMRLQELADAPQFRMVYENPGGKIFKVLTAN